MKILVKCIILFFFVFPVHADVAQCVADYNEAVKERKNANGSYINATNFKNRGLSDAEKYDRKNLYQKSLEWINVAFANLARAERLIDKVKKGGCPETLIENASGLTQKNYTDKGVYETMKKDLELKISIMK